MNFFNGRAIGADGVNGGGGGGGAGGALFINTGSSVVLENTFFNNNSVKGGNATAEMVVTVLLGYWAIKASMVVTAVRAVLDTPGELLDVVGQVNAFLGAEVKILGSTVYDNHFATLPLLKFGSGASGRNTGVGADGYIAGGTVFFDANFNKVLDSDEPYSVTNADGSYDLDILLYLFDVNADEILDPQEGQIVIIDGVDISTNLPQTTPLVALLNEDIDQ